MIAISCIPPALVNVKLLAWFSIKLYFLLTTTLAKWALVMLRQTIYKSVLIGVFIPIHILIFCCSTDRFRPRIFLMRGIYYSLFKPLKFQSTKTRKSEASKFNCFNSKATKIQCGHTWSIFPKAAKVVHMWSRRVAQRFLANWFSREFIFGLDKDF